MREREREREREPEWQPSEPSLWRYLQARLAILSLRNKEINLTKFFKNKMNIKEREREREKVTVKLEGLERNGVSQDSTNFFELLGVAGHEGHRPW